MESRVTVATAALMIGRSYNQVLRLIMIGSLAGGRDDRGRWWVDAADLQRFRATKSERSEKLSA